MREVIIVLLIILILVFIIDLIFTIIRKSSNIARKNFHKMNGEEVDKAVELYKEICRGNFRLYYDGKNCKGIMVGKEEQPTIYKFEWEKNK